MAVDSEKLYFQSSSNIVETLKANEIPDSRNIDEILLNKIKDKMGDKCIQTGYVKKDSIKILERSIGKINSAHFNGAIHYYINVGYQLCVPTINTEVYAKVIGKNQAGILCVNEPLHIMLSPETQNDTDIYNHIEKNDIILVKILRYKIMLDHDHIRVLAQFVNKK